MWEKAHHDSKEFLLNTSILSSFGDFSYRKCNTQHNKIYLSRHTEKFCDWNTHVGYTSTTITLTRIVGFKLLLIVYLVHFSYFVRVRSGQVSVA